MSKTIPEYQIKQNLLNAFGDQKNISQVLNYLKNNLDYQSAGDIISYMLKNIPTFNKYFFGSSFSKDITELGTQKTYFYRPRSLKNELNWTILSIKYNSWIVKKFLIYRKSFEHAILLGENENALQILSDAEKEIGLSIWLYESKFLVYELMKKPENAISLLSSINEARSGNESSDDSRNEEPIRKKK